MKSLSSAFTHLLKSGIACLLAVAVIGTSSTASAEIIRVEEDWVVLTGIPDVATTTPQIINVISPLAELEGTHAVFELNCRSLPEFNAGGMQLQRWMGEEAVSWRHVPEKFKSLSLLNERIEYTMAMEISAGNLIFEVKNGNSTTWGNFGGAGYLKSSAATTLSDLSGYRVATSVENSAIGRAAHRVQFMYLKEVRVYTAEGLLTTDTTPRVVHKYEMFVDSEEE